MACRQPQYYACDVDLAPLQTQALRHRPLMYMHRLVQCGASRGKGSRPSRLPDGASKVCDGNLGQGVFEPAPMGTQECARCSASAPVSSMSGPTARQAVSTSVSACVISTLPSSPTGDGARTPPICKCRNHLQILLLPVTTCTGTANICITCSLPHAGDSSLARAIGAAQGIYWQVSVPCVEEGNAAHQLGRDERERLCV